MEHLEDERRLSKFACDLGPEVARMIQVYPARLSTLREDSLLFPLGLLDTLPAELLLLILHQLDFQSLARLAQTCFRGRDIVENYDPYHQVIKHAPKVPTALAQTKLVSLFSAVLVLNALRACRCLSCFAFGAFLYLPTCQRVCLECLFSNQALWMITTSTAKRCFRLKESHFHGVPVMRSLPGTYSVRGRAKTHRRNYQMISVRYAKQLAVDIHGSLEQVEMYRPWRIEYGGRATEFYKFTLYHDVPLDPPGSDMSKRPSWVNTGDDRFAGMASLRVPFVTSSGADWGYLCRGCRITYRHFIDGVLPASVSSELSLSSVYTCRGLFALALRMHSRQGLLDHVGDCYGSQQMLRAGK